MAWKIEWSKINPILDRLVKETPQAPTTDIYNRLVACCDADPAIDRPPAFNGARNPIRDARKRAGMRISKGSYEWVHWEKLRPLIKEHLRTHPGCKNAEIDVLIESECRTNNWCYQRREPVSDPPV